MLSCLIRIFSTGPITVGGNVILMITNTILQVAKPSLPSQRAESNMSKLFFISNPVILFGSGLFATVSVFFIPAEEFALFLSLALFIGLIEDAFIAYYIYKTPNLKRYIIQEFHTSKSKVVLGHIYFIIETMYDCFIFFFFCGLLTHWPKRKDLPPKNKKNPENPPPINSVAPVEIA